MKTSMIKNVLALTLMGLTLSCASYASGSEKMGTLNVSILDENGAVVQDAPIYIYGEHKTHFVGGKEIPGTVTLTMPAGEYRISSAIVKKNGEYLDRYASHEAHIQVLEGDNTSVILTLKSISDPVSSLSYAEVHKIGVPSEIARNFN